MNKNNYYVGVGVCVYVCVFENPSLYSSDMEWNITIK